MKLYLVSSGDYSDYKVIAIFSSKEKAERWMKKVDDFYNDIEEFELDYEPECFNYLERGYSIYCIKMNKIGSVQSIINKKYFYEMNINVPFIYYEDKMKKETVMDCDVLAKNEKHAIKIANEIRSQVIALNLWDLGKINFKYPLEELNI